MKALHLCSHPSSRTQCQTNKLLEIPSFPQSVTIVDKQQLVDTFKALHLFTYDMFDEYNDVSSLLQAALMP